MTTKILTGTYSAGYTLSPAFAELIISPPAVVGGAGVRANALATIENEGSIGAGAGVAGGAGHFQGGMGSVGVDLAAGGRLINFGALTAGQGGAGTYNAQTGNGYSGGTGGSGILFPVGGAIVDHATIAGGAGGAGARGAIVGRGNSGSGGAGGLGIVLEAGGSLAIGGGNLVVGGQGGVGGKSYAYYRLGGPGNGGAGGGGVELRGPETITNLGTIAGGAGGAGGSGYNYSGRGGAGGYGMRDFYAGVSLTNTGLIEGGQGGGGGYRRGVHSGYPGAGGAGGLGVELLGVGAITNLGTIMGGAGGPGGAAAAGGPVGATGAAGIGVRLDAGGFVTNGSSTNGTALISGADGVLASDATLINFGVIAGAEYSVTFSSIGTLIAEAGAQFLGQIGGGGNATLVLAGGAGAISGLGGSGVMAGTDNGHFEHFATYVIGAGGAWALTGANSLAGGRIITDDGALVVEGSLNTLGGRVNVAAGAGLVFTGSGSYLGGFIGGAGSVAFVGGSDTLNGTGLLGASIAVSGATVTLEGTITTSGTVSVATPALLIGAGGASLAGGTWALTDSAANKVTGLAAGDTLNNASAIISGAGMLGAGQMVLINRSDGVIDGAGQNALIIDTGASQIATSGLIEATGAGGVTIQSAVLNGGRLEADGGTLTVNGAVTGPNGSGLILSGRLVFNAAFSENVTFGGTSGVLRLAQSQGYAGAITGFSHTGGTSLDLGDIGFVSSTEATFSGTATSGVLTVTDGTHTARITLIGNYLGSTFTASADNNGGVIIVDPPKAPSAIAPAHRFIAAAAGLGGSAGEAIHAGATRADHVPMLARPHTMIALA